MSQVGKILAQLFQHKYFRRLILAALLIASGLISNGYSSQATSNAALSVYLDAPFVQNSYVYSDHVNDSTPSTRIMSFESAACTFDGPSIATVTGCFNWNAADWGGATTLGSDPTVGEPSGFSASFGTVQQNQKLVISFSTAQTYLGMWWSAGSGGNQIEFYNGDQIIAVTNADDISSTLRNTGNLSSLLGDAYLTENYIGNPRLYSFDSNSQTYSPGASDVARWEPFTYVHFFGQNGQTFDKVVLSGPGFEFDNLVVSNRTDLVSTMNQRLVFQKNVPRAQTLTFNPTTAFGGTGQLLPQYDSAQAAIKSLCPDYPTDCIGNSYNGHLVGWNTQPDGSGDSYSTEDSFPFSESATLYAQWAYDFYLTDTGNWLQSNVNGDLVLPTPNPRTGYTFSGWSGLDADGKSIQVGQAGASIPFNTYKYVAVQGQLVENWLPDGTVIPNITAQITKIPLDPRLSQATIPSLPVDNPFTLCVSEVSDATGQGIADPAVLSFGYQSLGTSETGTISITSTSPITSSGSRFVKIQVSDPADVACLAGNAVVIELSPLGLLNNGHVLINIQ